MKEKVSCDLLLSLLDTKETLKELFKFCETTRNSSILFDSRKQNIAMLFLSAAVLILNACPFFLSGFSFTNIHYLQDSRGRGGYLFNSSLPLPPASQTLRYQPGDYCRGHLCTWLAAGLEPGTFGFRVQVSYISLMNCSIKFQLSSQACEFKNFTFTKSTHAMVFIIFHVNVLLSNLK